MCSCPVDNINACYQIVRMIVAGYDTSLPEIDIQIRLSNHFSSC